MARAREPAEVRFWRKVKPAPADECWVWTGTQNRYGYGQFWNGSKLVRAHRWAYEFLRTEIIPWNLSIDHLCSNKPCVNPYHLEPVDWGENSQRSARMRRARGEKFGPNVQLHRDRHGPRPATSMAPVYRRIADEAAEKIDSGIWPAGSEITYLSGAWHTANPTASAVDLLALWGLVEIADPVDRFTGRAVVLDSVRLSSHTP